MPTWVYLLGIVLTNILTWVLRGLYDLKVKPKIEKSQRQAEKLESEREEKEKRERQNRELSRKKDIAKLTDLKGDLERLNSIGSFPDSYTPEVCHRLLCSMRLKAEQIEQQEFQPIREKLLKFSDKKGRLISSMMLTELMNLINGKYDNLQPQNLINEINTILADAQK